MEIVHITAECYPVSKADKFGDFIKALPKYQNKSGYFGRVIIPLSDKQFSNDNQFDRLYLGFMKLGNFNFPFHIQKERNTVLGFELYLV